ncbi:MAG: peptidase MA family metallohydrolase [candidate division KSB1 bacterium]|nr:peptidase MA family metallohydrolase [candidate division KSB1 bacterium]MDZ7336008.1 peptidase MA family metallohydrolase [candidate division KSB1 bacterium]MDZ7358484.1 peptidase MA family metallohydrolase [candidate division KSB1 bacterium]MDZ7402022.1 peptidase MA family metallohydrolase [candidate division KSB1 bacterium]
MKHFLIVLLVLVLLSQSQIFAQYFGKNKVQYEHFEWQFIQSEHFDIYFTKGGEKIAEFAAEIAEASYQQLKKDLRYELVDRITIITHNSHNDFQQTNVDLNPPEESVGGFTEFFKNRVVVPYEGEWERFRHVIHHELTHAVMLQMVYGAGVQSIITGMARLRLPLWLIEGLAEYESRGWDTESDMFMRDATLNSYVPEIDYLDGFMAYKGGQSLLYYMGQKYGGEKIGELLGKIKLSKSTERGLKQAIGLDTRDLTKKWQTHLKREYWPDIANRSEPEEIAKRMTDHTKWRNFVNSGPALSPKGDKLAFLSDRSGYFDIYLMSAIDGKILKKLVSGQQSGDLEELHWLRAGISWSPDSKFIAFAAKSMGDDVLHIVDVKKAKIVQKIALDLDGVFTPSWSPLGDEIAFMGIKHGQGDIYSYNLKTRELRKLTDDVFSDLQPQWSPDGKKIAFVSDRRQYVNINDLPSDFKIYHQGLRNLDIYLKDVETGQIERITATPNLEGSPVFSPKGDRLAYISDASGIFNIYIYDLKSGINYPITNVITGVFNLSWHGDESKLAFVSFYNAGYDIYLLKNPLKILPGTIKLEETNFIAKHGHNELERNYAAASKQQSDHVSKLDESLFRNFVFDEKFAEGKIEIEPTKKSVFLDSAEYKSPNGEYRISKYRVKFSPDILYGSASYSQFYGVQGLTQIALSDVLGNHRIDIYTNLFYDLRNSNYELMYFYLPRQTDWGIGGYHYTYFYYIYNSFFPTWARDRFFGLNLYASHPFSKFSRIDGTLQWVGIDRDLIQWELPTEKVRLLLAGLYYIKDTVLWGYTGPINGHRYMLGLNYSPGIGPNSYNFVTAKVDYRKYIRLGKDYNFVYRLAAGISEGKNPHTFFLGGTSGWLNYKTRGGLRVADVNDIYFSSFEVPMRGGYYYERYGDRFMLNNLEFRFPLIRYFLMGWPIPLGFQDIRGALFTDIGAAWFGDKFRGAIATDSGFPALKDIFLGYGIGARMNLGFFIFRFDVAWSSDLVNYTHGPFYYVSLGSEF